MEIEWLRELLDRADRDGDGFTTGDELRKEVHLRVELKKQLEKAMRSATLAAVPPCGYNSFPYAVAAGGKRFLIVTSLERPPRRR